MKEQRQVRRPTLIFTLVKVSWKNCPYKIHKGGGGDSGGLKDEKPEPKLLKGGDKEGGRKILAASS